jgi:mannose-6-phosphate isomerase-like protein (cupin superfamily)
VTTPAGFYRIALERFHMDRVSIADVDRRMGPAADKRALASALDAERLALNYYELEPGDSFGFGYHRHPDQEEVFYVVEGTATFETEDGDVAVSAGEAVRFAPGEWQRGRNEGDETAVALAMGAPKSARETEMLRECPDCGGRTENTIEMTDDRDALVTKCLDCGAETGRFT